MKPFATMIVPYRETEDRRVNWNLLKERWKLLAPFGLAEIIEQDSRTEEWNKSVAIAEAVMKAKTEYVIIMDADVWIPDFEKVLTYLADRRVPYLIPHHRLYRLNRVYTNWVTRGDVPFERLRIGVSNIHLDESFKKATPGGGCVVVRTSTLRRFVPFDPRHPSWGNEDRDWFFAMKTLVGPPIQFQSSMYHLYHSKQVRKEREFGSPADKALHLRYRDAYEKAEAMSVITREAQAAIREIIPEW